MIVSTVYGDLIERFKEGKYWGIGHGANCFCRMGSGIAAQIAEEFPNAYYADKITTRGDRNKLGHYTFCNTEYGSIFNFYTQYTYWDENDMFSYYAVRNCFLRLNDNFPVSNEEKVFGIPMIGAGLARGDWNRIEKIINESTPDLDIELVIYQPKR